MTMPPPRNWLDRKYSKEWLNNRNYGSIIQNDQYSWSPLKPLAYDKCFPCHYFSSFLMSFCLLCYLFPYSSICIICSIFLLTLTCWLLPPWLHFQVHLWMHWSSPIMIDYVTNMIKPSCMHSSSFNAGSLRLLLILLLWEAMHQWWAKIDQEATPRPVW